jgi:hypothetical protein
MEAAVILLVIGGVAGLLVAGKRKAARQREMWGQSCAALGLTFQRGPYFDRYIHATRHYAEMYGTLAGQDVYVGVRKYTTHNGKSSQTHYYTYVDVIFDKPLKRGLRLQRANAVSRLFASLIGQSDIQVGHDEVDRAYKIAGQDAAQIRALLGDRAVLAELLRPYGAFSPQLTDASVRLEATGIVVDQIALEPAVRGTVAIARALRTAWQQLPPSAEERRITRPWQRVCERAGLSYEPRAMVARGSKGDVQLRVELVLDDKHGWITELQALFSPPLGVGLELVTQRGLAVLKRILGGQDIELGHRAFDDAFVVKGADPELVRQMLTGKACDALLELHGRTDELRVRDAGLLLRSHRIIDDEGELAFLLQHVVGSANAIVSHRKPTPSGPFR